MIHKSGHFAFVFTRKAPSQLEDRQVGLIPCTIFASPPTLQGFYNSGWNSRRCTKCPGSLTTVGVGTISSYSCAAPAGFAYQRGKAIPCAQGTFKAAIGNQPCDTCPDGFTTKFGLVSMKNASDCNCAWCLGVQADFGEGKTGMRGNGRG